MPQDATATARAANDFNRLFPDWTLTEVLSDTDYLDDTPEPEPVNAHCPGCRCRYEVPEVREMVKRVGKRVIRKTTCGPFTI